MIEDTFVRCLAHEFPFELNAMQSEAAKGLGQVDADHVARAVVVAVVFPEGDALLLQIPGGPGHVRRAYGDVSRRAREGVLAEFHQRARKIGAAALEIRQIKDLAEAPRHARAILGGGAVHAHVAQMEAQRPAHGLAAELFDAPTLSLAEAEMMGLDTY